MGVLSEKLFLKILNYFSDEEIFEYIIPVCNKWRNIVLKHNLHVALKASNDKTNLDEKLHYYPYIYKLNLNKFDNVSDILRRSYCTLKNLQFLIIRNCFELNEIVIRNILFVCPKLYLLDLKGTNLKGYKFFEEIGKMETLKSVNFGGNSLLTMQNLFSFALNCHKGLQELHLTPLHVVINDKDGETIVNSLKNGLKALSITATNLDGRFYMFLKEFTELEYLCLHCAHSLNDDLFKGIYLPNLKVLKIRFAFLLTGSSFVKFFQISNKLQFLDLTGCTKLNNNSLNVISLNCKALNTLILRSCKRITNLYTIFQNCPQLRVLNIAFCDNIVKLQLPQNVRLVFCNSNEQIQENGVVLIKKCSSEFNKILL